MLISIDGINISVIIIFSILSLIWIIFIIIEHINRNKKSKINIIKHYKNELKQINFSEKLSPLNTLLGSKIIFFITISVYN